MTDKEKCCGTCKCFKAWENYIFMGNCESEKSDKYDSVVADDDACEDWEEQKDG